jgi:hypothetical protein
MCPGLLDEPAIVWAGHFKNPKAMELTLDKAIANFGAKTKEKLANPAATGQPEDQLRAPFEHLLADLAELSDLAKGAVTAVGESAQSDLKTRPDYSVTVHNALVGFVELKAPGKGADPRKFKGPHDSMTYGWSTARQKGINRTSIPVSFKRCSSLFASCWLRALQMERAAARSLQGCCFIHCHPVIERISSRRSPVFGWTAKSG